MIRLIPVGPLTLVLRFASSVNGGIRPLPKLMCRTSRERKLGQSTGPGTGMWFVAMTFRSVWIC